MMHLLCHDISGGCERAFHMCKKVQEEVMMACCQLGRVKQSKRVMRLKGVDAKAILAWLSLADMCGASSLSPLFQAAWCSACLRSLVAKSLPD